jgi:hypothetical protein
VSRRRAGAAILALLATAAQANVETAPAPRARPADLAVVPSADGGPAPTDAPAAEGDAEGPDASAARPDAGPPPGAARLKGLDKFSGIARAFDAPYGVAVAYERLQVTVGPCRRDPDSGGVVAFVTVVDRMTPDATAFRGWVFSASPALSALDHPRYDVWLLSCSTASGGAP